MGTYNPVIGRDPWTALATFSADTAAAGYPASNLGTSDLNAVYRSTQRSAVISIVFSKPVPLGLGAIIRHNMRQAATLRWQLYTDAAFTTLKYDTDADSSFIGGNDVWPRSYAWSQLDYEDDNWLTMKPRTEQLKNKSWDRPMWLNDKRYLVQSAKLTLADPFNSDGYIQIGRLELARGFQFSRGVSQNAQSGFAPNSIVTQADGGREYGQLKMKPIVFQGTFPTVLRAEAELLKAIKDEHDIVPEQGIYWHPYPQDLSKWLLNSAFMRFQSLDLHQIATPVHDGVPISLRQIM